MRKELEKCWICGKSEVRIKTDGSKYIFKQRKGCDFICGACVSFGPDSITDANVMRGLTFMHRKSKAHTYVRNFSLTAMRRAYIKALFLEDERWIRHFEGQDKGRIINSIVECTEKNRTEKNLELQAELKDQIYSNLKYRKGYYESWLFDEVPTTRFNKYLHTDVRRFIRKYHRYKNKTENMPDGTGEFYEEVPKVVPLKKQISEDGIEYYIVFDPAMDEKPKTYTVEKEHQDGDRKISDRGIFDGVVRHEKRADRHIKKPTMPTVHKALTEEKTVLRRRRRTMVTRKSNQHTKIRG
jgi:hypothetical protein